MRNTLAEEFGLTGEREREIRRKILKFFVVFNMDKAKIAKSILKSYKDNELQWALVAFRVLLSYFCGSNKSEKGQYTPRQSWC